MNSAMNTGLVMSVRATSAEAWYDFCDSRSICESRRRVINALADFGPMTAGEIVEVTGQQGLWKRTSELQDMLLIEEKGTKQCSVSGKEAIVWALVPVIPHVIALHYHMVRFRVLFRMGIWADFVALIARQGGLEKNSYFQRQFKKQLWPEFKKQHESWNNVEIMELTMAKEQDIGYDKFQELQNGIFRGVTLIQVPY